MEYKRKVKLFKMKILVTGGAGYLGCVLVPELLKKGYSVKIIDNLLYKYKPNFLKETEFIKSDINNQKILFNSLKDVDVVIHLAALVGDQVCDLNKDLAIKTNFLTTERLATLCKKMNIKLIFASTCSVYGASKTQNLITEESKVVPLSIYSLSKLAAEESILRLANKDFKPIVFRMGTIHGYSPRMRFDLVGNTFIAKAIQEKKISVYGGNQWRPLSHIKDIVKAYLNAINSNKSGVFNLGGKNYRIIDLAKSIASYIPCEIITYKELKDLRNYKVSSKKAQKSLGIQFEHGIEESIKEIKSAYESGLIKDYKDKIYSNVKAFLGNK